MPDLHSLRARLTNGLTSGLAVLAGLTLAGAMLAPASAATAPAAHAPRPQHDPIVAGHLVKPTAHSTGRSAIRPFRAPAPIWPAAMTTTVRLAGPARPASALLRLPPGRRLGVIAPQVRTLIRAGTSPLWLGQGPVATQPAGSARPAGLARQPASVPAQVRVRIFGHAATKAAGVDGVLAQLTNPGAAGRAGTVGTAKTAGPVSISLDYARFRWAYGGDWADRLQLVELTRCAITSPAPMDCHLTPLRFRNDIATDRLTTTIQVKPAPAIQAAPQVTVPNRTRPVAPESIGRSGSRAVFLAATSSPSGSGGSFAATSLSESSSWAAGSSSGDFQWTYPLRTPPALGGPAPALALTYDSAAVDGQMATSNNQPSSVGEGFDMTTGYIERTYTACADEMGGNANNTVSTGDMCWGTANATLVLAGHSGELIQDASNQNRWHLRGDDGTYVSQLTGASNGSYNGEYWVVTTTNGTQYWFGKDASGNNSAWTEPVYGNNPGEPCHASTFAASSCTQVWRWNLDRVVDPSGNTMDYYYTAETNMYAADDNTSSPVSYVRGGYLNKITYGTRTGSTGNPPMQVVFTMGQRCVTSSCSTHDGTNWPDVPWDMQCTGAPCLIGSPTFWNTDRLATIQTQLYSGTGTTYNPVTTWTLTQTMPDPGDGTDAGLWLSSIVQAGQDGSPSISLPPVTFTPLQLANRVDTLGGALPPMNWMRMATITTETGSEIEVTYNPSTCVAGTSSMPSPSALQNNTFTCYPVSWQPPGYSSPITDFFNKYTVAEVADADLTTPGNPTTITSYKYSGNPAWHYTDTTGIVPAKQRSWATWRGYPTVETDTGTGAGEQSVVTSYFQGMNGDFLPGGGSRSVTLPAVDVNQNGSTTDAADAPAVPDDDAFAGLVRSQVTYNGPGGAEVRAVFNNPWESAPTATTTVNGITVNARFTNIADTHARTDLDGGRAPLTTSTHTTFDSMGEPVSVQYNGNDAVTGDERCTLTSYARNMASDGSTWLVSFPDRVRRFATDCATAQAGGLTADQVVSDTLTYYDGSTTLGTPPTRGLVTRTDELKTWANSTPAYLTTSLASYDANGRVTSATDVRGNATTAAYATNAGGQLLTTTTTNALGWVSAVTDDPATGLPVQSVDPNGRITSQAYDALGRLTAVWQPGRDMATQSANITYSYLIRDNAPDVVTTSTLTSAGGYLTSYQLYDGLLRPIQSQGPRGDGAAGALISDTFYNSAGLTSQADSSYLAAITPGSTLFVANQQNVPQRTLLTYDGAARQASSVVYNLNSQGVSVPFATTTIGYGGDRTDVTPPAGGVATSTITDVWGNTVALRQYHGSAPTPSTPGSYDVTTYAYNNKNQLVTVTDPAGNQWKTTYDVRGRVISTASPDSGTITTTYDDAGDVTAITDARGITLNYNYDGLGRKTGLYNGAVNSADQLATWTYDGLANSRGQLTKSVSYDNGNAYTTTINGLTAGYQPTSVTYTIPAAETGLAGSYTYVYTYAANGAPSTIRLPDLDGSGGLSQETITEQYNALSEISGLSTSVPVSTSLVPSISYTGYGEPAVMTLQTNGGNQAYESYTYDQSSRRLTEQAVTKQTSPTSVADVHYSYDASGNILSADDSVSGDDQCFSYDYADRLSSAWTPAGGNCAAAKSVSGLGGPAPYWDGWTYNPAGSRISQVAHDTQNGTATTSYSVPAPGAAQPHAVTSTSTVSSAGTKTASYGYDADGNLTSRPSPTGPANQTLSYNPRGHLASVADNGSTTTFSYDAAGTELIERDAGGRTLYLPDQELRYTASSGAKATTRYYSIAGQTVAMRTASGVTWMMADRQGTANITIDNTSQAVSERYMDPFGGQRGSTSGSWPAADTQGYLGGTQQPDGLTHLGDRQYDPTLGRFISVDPDQPTDQPQRYDGYTYCANNPIAATDPTGTSSSNDGTWTPEFWLGPYSWNQDGYHFQELDLVEFLCQGNGSQCVGAIQNSDGEWLTVDSNGNQAWSKTQASWWWIPMSDVGSLLDSGYSLYFIARVLRFVSRTPLTPPAPPCLNLSASGGPLTTDPDPTTLSGINPACTAFFSFWIFGNCGFNDWMDAHAEDLVKYAAGAAMALSCVFLSVVGCFVAGVALGTEENLYDYLSAGGSSAPNADQLANSFWVNEAVTIGTGFIPSNNAAQTVASDLVSNIPFGPNSGTNMITNGGYNSDPLWTSTNPVLNMFGSLI